MNILSLLLPLFTFASSLPDTGLTAVVPNSQSTYGVKNFRTVMPGLLYRGGGEGAKAPLSSGSLQKLCDGGFRSAVYGYKTGWTGEKSVSCGSGEIRYTYRQWDSASAVKAMHRELYELAKSRGGAMYVHCWYGVHASGYMVATALMQFCGYSAEQAVSYWNSNVPEKIRYPKVQNAIRAFRIDTSLQLSGEEQATYCPR